MTQPPGRPTRYPMAKDTEAEFYEALVEKLDAHFITFSDYLDDNIDGFHKKPPRERILLYQASEPVFDPNIPTPMIELFLEQGAYEPLVDVFDLEGLIRPPQVDPLTGAVTPALLGQAPVLLGEYWRRLWAVDRVEGLRCLRDYRDILRREGRTAS
jgi:hypothetical protein